MAIVKMFIEADENGNLINDMQEFFVENGFASSAPANSNQQTGFNSYIENRQR
jgi:hypothetical protein